MSQDNHRHSGEPRRITRAEFHAAPDHYILACEEEGPILVVDDEGVTRMVLSSPLARDETHPSE